MQLHVLVRGTSLIATIYASQHTRAYMRSRRARGRAGEREESWREVTEGESSLGLDREEWEGGDRVRLMPRSFKLSHE
jgi:hypothetical protein